MKNWTPRQKRLVAVKELCHIAIDTEEDFSTAAIDTLERMLSPGLDKDAPENLAFRSGILAELVAWELLYPFENRAGDKDAIQEGTESVANIAKRYQIPEDVVEMVLRTPYMEMCHKFCNRSMWRIRQSCAKQGMLAALSADAPNSEQTPSQRHKKPAPYEPERAFFYRPAEPEGATPIVLLASGIWSSRASVGVEAGDN